MTDRSIDKRRQLWHWSFGRMEDGQERWRTEGQNGAETMLISGSVCPHNLPALLEDDERKRKGQRGKSQRARGERESGGETKVHKC